MAPRLRRLTILFILAAAFGLAVLWGAGSLLLRSTNAQVPSPGSPAHLVAIDSSPHIKLVGSYWPYESEFAPTVLLLHGNGSNRAAMTKLAVWLNAQGYAVLAIDFRGHGQSTAATKSFGLFEAADAQAAIVWLRRARPKSKLGVIGFSLGGAACLIGKDGPVKADALVLEGVYPDIRHAIFNRLAIRLGRMTATISEPLLSLQSMPRFGMWPSELSPINALKNVHEPVMIVGGGADRNTPPEESMAMFEVVRGHGELLLIPELSHDELGHELPDSLKPALLAFLDRHLRPRGTAEAQSSRSSK